MEKLCRIVVWSTLSSVLLVGCGKPPASASNDSKSPQVAAVEHEHGANCNHDAEPAHADKESEAHEGSEDPHDQAYAELATVTAGPLTLSVSASEHLEFVKLSSQPIMDATVRGLIVNGKGDESIKVKAEYCGGHKEWSLAFEELPTLDNESKLLLEVEIAGATHEATVALPAPKACSHEH